MFLGVLLTILLLGVILLTAFIGYINILRYEHLRTLYAAHGYDYSQCKATDNYPVNSLGVRLGQFYIWRSGTTYFINNFLGWLFFLCPASNVDNCRFAFWIFLGDFLFGVWIEGFRPVFRCEWPLLWRICNDY